MATTWLMMTMMTGRNRLPQVLLHICCGPCATHVIDVLHTEFEPVGFFFNPNIHPRKEFVRRLIAAVRVCRAEETGLLIPQYLPGIWMKSMRGKESDREGGARCLDCYRIRLEATARAAKAQGIEAFATTLTISPHKQSREINEIGESIANTVRGVSFLARDFKKRDGFKISVEKSRDLGLYRQHYCGCCFSQKPA